MAYQKGIKLENIFRLRHALSLVWQSAPGWTTASAALIVLQGFLPLVSLYLIKLLVDTISNSATRDAEGALSYVILLITISGLVALLLAFSRSLATLASEAQSQAVTDHVQDVLHAKSIEIDLEYYENSQFYDSFHRAQQEAPFRPTRIVNGLVQVFQNAASLLAIVGLLVSFQWILALLLLVASIPGVFVKLRYANKMFRWQCRVTPIERKAWYLHLMLTDDGHAKEIRLFGLGSIFRDQYKELRRIIRQEKLEITKSRSLTELVTQVGSTLAIFGSLALVAHSALQGAITVGSLVMYFGAFQQGQNSLQGIMIGLASLYEDNLFLTSLYQFLELKQKVAEPSDPVPFPDPIATGIAFEGVGFHYADREKEAVSDINLTIKPGQIVALVGENGSGKTTLIKLLCRLYDPTKGRITIDGIDLRRFKIESLRREIGVIFQDYAKYYLTARENIWFGDVFHPIDQDTIAQAAHCSGADDVIRGLDNGYETILGKYFEGGEELSIGEWQKVALSRSFIRDSAVMVLDEPTSSIDARAEEHIFDNFRRIAKGKTALIISHRLSTVRMADRIYYLADGRIAEEGSHDELMALNGEYAKLFETQAKYYI